MLFYFKNNMKNRTFLMLFFLLIACSSVDTNKNKSLPVEPNINLIKADENNCILAFNMLATSDSKSAEHLFLRDIKEVYIKVFEGTEIIDSAIITRLEISGIASTEGKTSSTLFFRQPFNFTNRKIEDMLFVFEVKTSNEVYEIRKLATEIDKIQNKPSEQPLELIPSVAMQNDSTALFTVTATRLANVINEYIPTSEEFRVEILSGKGNLIWSSNFGMNYLQVILQVRPEKIGDTYKYSLEWNGQTNKGVPATPGNYTANLIIPARPNQYSSTIQFHWK